QRRRAAHQRPRPGHAHARAHHPRAVRGWQHHRAARHRRRLPERSVQPARARVRLSRRPARRESLGATMVWFKKGIKWQLETDVLVIGTGGAGMTAALAAHAQGAKVAIVDKATK